MTDRCRALGWAVAAAVVASLAVIPAGGTQYVRSFFLLLFMYVTLAQSWNMISGYTGYLSFGHGVFFGIGAYTAAHLVAKFGWPFPLALLAAGGMAVLAALLLGVVFMRVRIRVAYFSITALGLNEIVKTLVVNNEWLGSSHGLTLPPLPYQWVLFYLLLAFAAASTLVMRWVDRAPFGLGLKAILQDEEAAEVNGVPTFRLKLLVFLVSAFFPGITGAVIAWHWSYIDPYMAFDLVISFDMAVMTVFGGIGTVWGPVLGATLMGILTETLWVKVPNLHGLIFGALVVAIVVISPGGLMEIGDRVRRSVAVRRWWPLVREGESV
jgi:branched-chain amino acid transport system permease protein